MLRLELLDALLGSQRAATQTRAGVELLAHEVEDAAHRLVVAATNLLELDRAHLRELGRWEGRMQHDVREELERLLQPRSDYLRRIAGEIGRASCRGRGENWRGGGCMTKK